MVETFTKESFWKQLDEEGEDKVRTKVLMKHYGAGNGKLVLAEEWLRRQESFRQAAKEQVNQIIDQDRAATEYRIANSSKNAAWFSGIVSALALVVSIIALWFSLKP